MRQRHSLLRPAPDESLAAFLRRAMKERGMSVPALATAMWELDGTKQRDSWDRQIKSWRSPNGPKGMKAENAGVLGAALSADFTTFIFDPTDRGWRDLLESLRDELAEVRHRVDVLEKHLSGR